MRAILHTIYRGVFCAVLFLFPFKFGCILGNGEQPNFPLSAIEWVFNIGYPASIPILIGALLLLLSAMLHPIPKGNKWQWAILGCWGLLFLSAIVGRCGTTEIEYANQWLLYTGGCLSFATAFAWHSAFDDRLLPWAMNTIACAALIACIHGIWQHFVGLEQNYRIAVELARQNKIELPEQMLAKLQQTRIYGCFIDPNVYASYLLLTAPVSLFSLYHWGLRFEYPRIGSIGLTAIGVLLFGGALFWTGSRGAAVGLAAAVTALLWCTPQVRAWRWRWTLPVLALVLATALIAVMSFGKERRGIATASIRVIYYQEACKLFLHHPIKGVGMGEFFTHYQKNKPLGAESTRNPHCFPLSLASQSGLLGLLAALAIYLLPWWMAGHLPQKEGRTLAITAITAVVAWTTHSLFQFNELVPGVLFTVAILPFAVILQNKGNGFVAWKTPRLLAVIAGIALVCISLRWCIGEISLQKGENALEKQHNAQLATLYYNRAMKQLPHNLTPYFQLDNLSWEKKDYDQCIKFATVLTKMAPHRSAPWNRLAYAQLALGLDATEAILMSRTWHPGDPKLVFLEALDKKKNDLSYAELQFLLHLLVRSSPKWNFHPDGTPFIIFQTSKPEEFAPLLELLE